MTMKKKKIYTVFSLITVLLIILYFTGCGSDSGVKAGDTVRVRYVGSFEDGTEFDSSPEGQPLQFVAGSGQVIPGFDNGVIGMDLNEGKRLVIPPEQGYGVRDETLIREFPRTSLPEDFIPEVGAELQLQGPQGQPVPARIVAVTDETISIDLNHPLVGKTLIFEIQIVEIIPKQ